ncbi:hypothetical protein A1O7_10018 [Cladophialophora yegresii CBS 114405]|uniref:Uncharacterized protein n=1 Tax=Cladophialophora yegresii CBS 114405 TaxID=1182544 RepID=W9VGB7_9EURO|nr:uncharacterized protein A1O7_10018 [Cladophialophora yegresii CBS 114405]EXJ54677.1 hypothetical protein A1O7_10018 [Cladophialophora yegresii CBS 114405]
MLTDENPTRPASLRSYFRAANGMNDGETTSSTRSALNARNAYNLRPPQYVPSFVHGRDATPAHIDGRIATRTLRQISGGFWTVGGPLSLQLSQLQGIPSGSGRLLASGTTAPLHTASFLDEATHDDKVVAHERRLALALDIDQASRVLMHNIMPGQALTHQHSPFVWTNGAWTRAMASPFSPKKDEPLRSEKAVPTVPFRVLDAPNLKDDYYCSILAYSYTCHTLAVALGQKVYLWTEQYGVRYPPLTPVRLTNFVTSLAFSSESGGKAILAVARNSGSVTLWSLLEPKPRFDAPHSCAASCVAFKPVETRRPDITRTGMTSCEDLLVGDDSGKIYYYSVQWPEFGAGSMTLLAKIDAHSQNICGLSWSPDGHRFVSGGNDNRALLFDPEIFLYTAVQRSFSQDVVEHAAAPGQNETGVLVTPPVSPERSGAIGPGGATEAGIQPPSIQHLGLQTPPPSPARRGREAARAPRPNRWIFEDQNLLPRQQSVLRNALANPSIPGQVNVHIHAFYHSAAVKAIAFAPWQPNLLATGGGSNDRQIHFFHIGSGATLTLINVFSQVTSLVWSTTRREIVATFGYSQPEHEIRIAVFSWPSCECVVSIPWERKQNGEIGRALWAIPYPGGPNDAIPTRRQSRSNEGFAAWEAVRRREAERRRGIATTMDTPAPRLQRSPAPSPDRTAVLTTPTRRSRLSPWSRPRDSGHRSQLRGEGEPWASRTQQEGSLIIACCDQTVKFFEIWAGKSKGKKSGGLGNRPGVLGGSRVLEGWCDYVDVDEIGNGEEVIR